MHSAGAFLAIAAAVTLSPGPAFALMLQVAARDGWRAALANIAGNGVGVLAWGGLSALGVSALVNASTIAFDVLHYGGAAFLAWLGARALFASSKPGQGEPVPTVPRRTPRSAFSRGILNSAANPKLAVFFVSLFPQFVARGHSVLLAAMAMAVTIVVFDFLWYGAVAYAVDHGRRVFTARIRRRLERVTGAILLAFSIRVATESR